MAKPEQALDIEPKHEIHFRGPYTQTVTERFKITNPTDRKIAFKVKTTAPKRYCVRPNNGVVNPGQTVSVTVMLQNIDNGSLGDKHRHKFMIQSLFVQGNETNFDDLVGR